MSDLRLGDDGFLPSGIHQAELADVRSSLVRPSLGDVRLRAAVLDGVAAWSWLARTRLGPGRLWLSGGFVAQGEADDLALVTYWPDEAGRLDAVIRSGAASSLVTLSDVAYADPPPGGTMEQRWPVSELVDAVLVEQIYGQRVVELLSTPLTVLGAGVPLRKGFIEVRCP